MKYIIKAFSPLFNSVSKKKRDSKVLFHELSVIFKVTAEKKNRMKNFFLPEIFFTFKTFTTSGGNCISAVLETRRYIRSTKIPARIAWATDRNFGFSSLFLRVVASWRVNVDASHSLTSGGTASGCTSDSSSSSSAKRLDFWK